MSKFSLKTVNEALTNFIFYFSLCSDGNYDLYLTIGNPSVYSPFIMKLEDPVSIDNL